MHYDPEVLRVLAAHSTKAARLQTDARWTKRHGDGGSRRVMVGKVKSVESIGTMPTYDIEVGVVALVLRRERQEPQHGLPSSSVSRAGSVSPTSRFYARAVRIHDTSPSSTASRLRATGSSRIAARRTRRSSTSRESDGGRVASEVSLAEQIELQATMQEVWSDNP